VSDPISEGLPGNLEDPAHNLKLWSKYEFQDGALHGVYLGLGGRVQSRTARGTLFAQKAYGLVDAQVGYNFRPGLSLSVSVNNLFDKSYFSRVPGRFFSQVGDPRNVMATLRGRF